MFKATKDAYTQPIFVPTANKIVMIKLVNGNSINTDIISLNLQSKKTKTILSQRSTQLEPYMFDEKNLYYSNVTCVEGCGKIIQEIWYKHIPSQDAYQLTLTNAISHQPSVDNEKQNIYFSSNKKGYYHIWKMSLINNQYTQLTKGEVTDSYPIPTKNNEVFFIRIKDGKSKLMKITKTGNIVQIALPTKYTKIRNLRMEK